MPKEDCNLPFSKKLLNNKPKRGYFKFPSKYEIMRRRVILRKIISRFRKGTLRVKWLEELEWEEELRAIIRFIECNINIYYK